MLIKLAKFQFSPIPVFAEFASMNALRLLSIEWFKIPFIPFKLVVVSVFKPEEDEPPNLLLMVVILLLIELIITN